MHLYNVITATIFWIDVLRLQVTCIGHLRAVYKTIGMLKTERCSVHVYFHLTGTRVYNRRPVSNSIRCVVFQWH